MIHFGIRELSYNVRFDESCYYPIVNPEDQQVHLLFGLCYGFSGKNSLNVGWRPSGNFLDKIDIFAIQIYNSDSFMQYVHTVDTKQDYDILLTTSVKHKFVGVEGYKMGENKKADRLFKVAEHYFYPWFRMGLTYKDNSGFNILLERN